MAWSPILIKVCRSAFNPSIGQVTFHHKCWLIHLAGKESGREMRPAARASWPQSSRHHQESKAGIRERKAPNKMTKGKMNSTLNNLGLSFK